MTITVNGESISGDVSDEEVEDIVAALVEADDKLSWDYDDENDTLTIETTSLDEQEVIDAIESEDPLELSGDLDVGGDIHSDDSEVLTQESSHHIGSFEVTGTGTKSITGVGFTPTMVKFHGEAVGGQNEDRAGGGGSNAGNYAGTFTGTARDDGHRQVIHSGASGDSINETSHFSSDSLCIGIRYAGDDGQVEGRLEGDLDSWDSDGFTVDISEYQRDEVIIYTAYR